MRRETQKIPKCIKKLIFLASQMADQSLHRKKMEKTEKNIDKKGDTPTFIKDIEFGPVRPKKN